GSAFKAFVYLTALESGLKNYTVRDDEPITLKGGDGKNWSPDNFEDEHYGPVTLEYALAHSINTIAVGLGQEVGIQSVIATAKRLGIVSPLQPNASLALGTSEVTPMELTASYAAFASGGYKAAPYTVTDVRTPDGKVLFHRSAPQPQLVIDNENMLAMNAML